MSYWNVILHRVVYFFGRLQAHDVGKPDAYQRKQQSSFLSTFWTLLICTVFRNHAVFAVMRYYCNLSTYLLELREYLLTYMINLHIILDSY